MDGNCSLNSSYESIVSVNSSCSLASELPDISSINETLQSLDESAVNNSTLLDQTLNVSDVSIVEDDNAIPVVANVDFCYQPFDVPYPSWYEPHHDIQECRTTVRRKIHRDNKLIESINLPIISVSNLRSLIPKINNFKEDMLERGYFSRAIIRGLGAISEEKAQI